MADQTLAMTPMKLVAAKEPWGEVLLENGTTIRFRLVIRGVQKVEGSVDAEGKQNYLLEHSLVTDVR